MTSIYQGPTSTRLVALSALRALPVGEKVRFLGCVIKYDISTATLTLVHNFPHGGTCKALVGISLLLGTLRSTDSQIGEWVNVMGYITAPSPTDHRSSREIKDSVSVQAIVLWSAGSIKLNEYENILSDQSCIS